MKSPIRKYLFNAPSLFAWLIALLFIPAIFYLVIGIMGLRENSEAVMAFLFIPYIFFLALTLALLDTFIRRLTRNRLTFVLIIELVMLLLASVYFFHIKFYRTRFITQQMTPLFVLVQDLSNGAEPQKSFFKQMTTIQVPADNIAILHVSLKDINWVNVSGSTISGKTYRQVYPMKYMDIDSLRCGDCNYSIQFVMLESDQYPHLYFSQKQFDSVKQAVCAKLLNYCK